MNRLRSNVVANIAGNAWATGLSLVLTPAYIKLLGVESYGLIGFYTSWLAILGILDTGISATAVRETAWLAARPEESRRIPSLLRTLEVIYWSVMVAIGGALLAGAALFGATWFRTANLSPDTVRVALMLMVVSLTVQVPSGLYVGGLMGLQRQVENAELVALFGTIRGVGAVALLTFVRADIRWFFGWQIFVSAMQTAVMRYALWRHVSAFDAPRHFSRAMLASVRGYAGGMTAITALSLVLNQMDKLILSRLISLEAFGFYMLAWTVASGLSRIAMPLMQAFAPRFTELVSRGQEAALGSQLRMASQVIGALILPPAALLVLAPRDLLLTWMANPTAATGAAPLLAILALGTVLAACSYPPLSVLYSRRELAPVLITNAILVLVLAPALWFAVPRLGAAAAAACWLISGLITYVVYQALAMHRSQDSEAIAAVVYDLAAPAVVSIAVAMATAASLKSTDGRLLHAAILIVGCGVGWCAALAVSRQPLRHALVSLRWKSVLSLS